MSDLLMPKATVAARITRAKRALAEAGVPIELPPPAELDERLGSVLEVVYADVPRTLWPAAARSVEAQLHYIRGN